MRNRFYPTLSALHEDPPAPIPPAGFFTQQYLVWAGNPGGPDGSLVVTPGGGSGAVAMDIIKSARIQIVVALTLGGIVGHMIASRESRLFYEDQMSYMDGSRRRRR